MSEVWCEDRLIWPYTVDGEYSVQSAYHLLATDDTHGMSSSSSPGNSQKI